MGLAPQARIRTRIGDGHAVGIGVADQCLWVQLDKDLARASGLQSVSRFYNVALTAAAVKAAGIVRLLGRAALPFGGDDDDDDGFDDDDDEHDAFGDGDESGEVRRRRAALLAHRSGGQVALGGATLCAVKLLQFGGRCVPVVLQNQNGPCPVIALINVLLLRGQVRLPVGPDVRLAVCASTVAAYIADVSGTHTLQIGEGQESVFVTELLHKILTGMDVNFSFRDITDFQMSPAIALFTIAEVPLLHLWLADAADADLMSALRSSSPYLDDVLAVLAVVDERAAAAAAAAAKLTTPAAANPDAPPLLAPPPPPQRPLMKESLDDNESTADADDRIRIDDDDDDDEDDDDDDDDDDERSRRWGKSKKQSTVFSPKTAKLAAPPTTRAPAKDDVKFTLSESETAALVAFYGATQQAQFTEAGIAALQRQLDEDAPAVLFFSNHFFVVTKHGGQLFVLVTDAGLALKPGIVWESLRALTARSSEFFDATFAPYSAADHPEPPPLASPGSESDRDTAMAEEAISLIVSSEIAAMRKNDLAALQALYSDTAMCMLAVDFDMMKWRPHNDELSVKRETEKLFAAFAVLKAEMIIQHASAWLEKGGTITCDYDVLYAHKETGQQVRDWFRATKFIQPVGAAGELKIVAVVRQLLRKTN